MRRYVSSWALLGALLCAPLARAAPDPAGAALQKLDRYYDTKQRYHADIARPPRQQLLRELGRQDTPEVTAQRLYGDAGGRIVRRLRSFGPGFDKLVYHPGLVTRLGQFKRFLNEHKLRDADPDVALAAFRRHLGTVTMYRAIAIAPAKEGVIETRGLESPLARHELDIDLINRPPAFVHQGIDGANGGFAKPLEGLIESRLTGWSDPITHPLLSVTDNPEIAIAATKPYSSAEKPIRLYTLRMPVLDLVHSSGKKGLLPRRDAAKWLDLTRPDGTKTRLPFASQSTESFVLFRIDPKEIVGKKWIDASTASTYVVTPRD